MAIKRERIIGQKEEEETLLVKNKTRGIRERRRIKELLLTHGGREDPHCRWRVELREEGGKTHHQHQQVRHYEISDEDAGGSGPQLPVPHHQHRH